MRKRTNTYLDFFDSAFKIIDEAIDFVTDVYPGEFQSFVTYNTGTNQWKTQETESGILYTLDFPGTSKEGVSVATKGSGIKVEVGAKVVSIPIPKDYDLNSIKAIMKDGRLTIEVTKKEEAEEVSVKVE